VKKYGVSRGKFFPLDLGFLLGSSSLDSEHLSEGSPRCFQKLNWAACPDDDDAWSSKQCCHLATTPALGSSI
jgi:hypothetical protein